MRAEHPLPANRTSSRGRYREASAGAACVGWSIGVMNAYLSGNGCCNGYLGGDLMDSGVTGGATRRQLLWTLGGAGLAAGAPGSPPEVDGQVVARNDAALERLLGAQITDLASPRLGGVADEYGMFHAGTAGSLIETAAASWLAPQSKHHRTPEVLQRIRHAARFLEHSQ